VHAIDIAKATRQQIDVSPAVADYVLGLARKTVTPQGRASGLFGEEIHVEDSQDSLTRLLAFTGREV